MGMQSTEIFNRGKRKEEERERERERKRERERREERLCWKSVNGSA